MRFSRLRKQQIIRLSVCEKYTVPATDQTHRPDLSQVKSDLIRSLFEQKYSSCEPGNILQQKD